jgi:hypothetical protein
MSPVVTLDTPIEEARFLWSSLGTTTGHARAMNECGSYERVVAWHDSMLSGGTVGDFMDMIAESGAPESVYTGLAAIVCTPELDASIDSDTRKIFAEASVSGKSLAHDRVPLDAPLGAGMTIPVTLKGSVSAASMLLAAFGSSLPADIYALCMPEQPYLLESIRKSNPLWVRHFEF